MDAMFYHDLLLLQPLDVLVVLKLSASPQTAHSYAELANSLGVSVSQAHRAVGHAQSADLLSQSLQVRNRSAFEMLTYGVRHFIPGNEGAESRGMPTSYGVKPLADLFGELDRVPVWPIVGGSARGPSVQPIYKTVPLAAQQDSNLHSLLAMVDAIRVGRARERSVARTELEKFFGAEE